MMNLETVVKRIDELEGRVEAFEKTYSNINDQISTLDNKVSRLPVEYRDIRDDVGQIKKTISTLTNVDATLNQLRIELNSKFSDFEKSSKQQQETQKKIRQTEISNITKKVDQLDDNVKRELDKRIQRFIDEDSKVLSTIEKVEESVNKKLRTDEDIRLKLDVAKKDINNLNTHFDVVSEDMHRMEKSQTENQKKLNILDEDIKRLDIQVTEINTSEAQRKSAQSAFIEGQEVANKNRELRFDEIQRKAAEEINKISPLVDRLNNKEKEISEISKSLDEATKLYERRLKEVTELYKLFESRYQKEWNSFKVDSEKNWSNYSLINDEKQNAIQNETEEIKKKLVDLTDQTQDIQELLGLMSDEIQKGMLNIMKMTNNWKEAFDTIQKK